MCGIAGIINVKHPHAHVASLVAMTKSMIRRGPDDEGYLLFDQKITAYHAEDSIVKKGKHINSCVNEKFKVGFGFRQLKIVDLSNNSHQPMTDEDEQYSIIFNGEIYNHREIRSELISKGHSFYSQSDTEVILKSYIQWGPKCLEKFNGMFAFSIFDKRENTVFIARDRIGIKPLYYCHSEHHFIFASTIKSLLDSSLCKPEIDWEGLGQNFRYSIAQRPHTSLKNVRALESAHYIIYNLITDTFVKRQYWEIPVGTQDLTMSEKQAADLLESSLTKSIKYRLQADVEVGSFMSGGIDSTLISVLASKINPDIKVFTLGFKEFEDYNEIEQAIDTAQLHKLNHIINCVHPNEILQNIDHTVTAYEEPYHHLSANFVLSKIASDNGAKVVLNGLGGDELFGGYDVFNKLALWQKLKRKKNIINLLPTTIHPKLKKANALANYNSIGEYYAHYYTTYSDDEINRLFLTERFDSQHTISTLYNNNNLKFTDDFEAMSFFNLKSYIGNHHLRTLDQFTMHFSMEGRIPFLDHEFITSMYTIPSKYKIKNNIQKYILREVAKKHIAPSCLNMSKKGLRLPLEHWISSNLKEFVQDTISSLKNRKIFNASEVDKILKSKNEMKIWQLVSTELWISKFID